MKIKLFITLLFSCVAFSQTKSLLENIKIDNNTKLIGMYSQNDKNQTYRNLNFFINDKSIISSLIEKLRYGKVLDNYFEQNGFTILILDGNEVVESWLVNPFYSNIIINGTYYKFDIEIIKELSKKYPFDYTFSEKTFSNKSDYKKYLSQIEKDITFIFAYEPFFEYEGNFEIQFPKNSQFESPQAIDHFLRPKILAIAEDVEFNISYNLNDFNIKNSEQFTMTIEGSKEIYNKLVLENLAKKNWKKTEDSGMFFMKAK